jgi:hypothetical protein
MTVVPVSMQQSDRTDPKTYPAEKARQGKIVLRQRWQRIVFIVGLAGLLLLALLLRFYVGF